VQTSNITFNRIPLISFGDKTSGRTDTATLCCVLWNELKRVLRGQLTKWESNPRLCTTSGTNTHESETNVCQEGYHRLSEPRNKPRDSSSSSMVHDIL